MKIPVEEQVIDYIIQESGEKTLTFHDVLEDLGVNEEDLTEESISLIKEKLRV